MSYAKMLAVVVATVLSAILAASMGNGVIDPTEWVNIAIQGVGALAVGLAANLPGSVWNYTKFIMAALTAGLTVLASAILGGVTYMEWIQIAIAVLAALGVFAVPNKKQLVADI